MNLKFRALSISITGTVLLAGLLPGCSQADNPQIKEVPNVSELKAEGKNEPTIVRGKELKKGEGYMNAFDPELRKKKQ